MTTATVFNHERLTTDRVVEVSGATYRQLGYWVDAGYLHPFNAGKGSGFPLSWPRSEVIKATLIVQLLGLGFHLPDAVVLARHPSERRKVAAALLAMEDKS